MAIQHLISCSHNEFTCGFTAHNFDELAQHWVDQHGLPYPPIPSGSTTITEHWSIDYSDVAP